MKSSRSEGPRAPALKVFRLSLNRRPWSVVRCSPSALTRNRSRAACFGLEPDRFGGLAFFLDSAFAIWSVSSRVVSSDIQPLFNACAKRRQARYLGDIRGHTRLSLMACALRRSAHFKIADLTDRPRVDLS